VINIRTGALIEAIRAQAAANPAKVYKPNAHRNQCEYVTDLHSDEPKPGCIVGAALLPMGVPVDVFGFMEGKYTPFNEMGVGALLTAMNKVEGYSTNAGEYSQDMTWLLAVQNYQDQGCPWAEAVTNADEAVSDVVNDGYYTE
jgi:hypothetical protein